MSIEIKFKYLAISRRQIRTFRRKLCVIMLFVSNIQVSFTPSALAHFRNASMLHIAWKEPFCSTALYRRNRAFYHPFLSVVHNYLRKTAQSCPCLQRFCSKISYINCLFVHCLIWSYCTVYSVHS